MSQAAKTNPHDEEERDPIEVNADMPDRPMGRPRHPFVAWVIASLRVMWSSLRHPGHPVWIDYRTGDVWLKRD